MNMAGFTERFDELSRQERLSRCAWLAETALQHYEVGEVVPRFIARNGSVTYRLLATDGRPLYVLKSRRPPVRAAPFRSTD